MSRGHRLAAAAVVPLALLAVPGRLWADPVQDVQFWTPTTIQKVTADDWFVQVETQVRLVDDVNELQNSLFRPAIGFRPKPALTVLAGYAWVPFFYPERRNEHRAWQQALATVQRGRWTLLPRVRFEQRFMQGVHGVVLRLRGQFKAQRAVSADGTWQASISDEVFVHLNDAEGGPASGFSANRVQVGVLRRVSRTLTLEPAYLLQFVNRARGTADEIDHVLMLTTGIRF